MNKDNIIDIEDLTPDAHNFNQGTDEGRQLMQRSLTELGAGRSILVDRNGNVIAGNKTQEAAIKAGIRKVRVIETDGTELVAVKRTDIDIDSAKGRELALVDNLATQVNLAWDEAELEAMDVEGFDPGQWGWEPPEMGDSDEQGQGEQPEAKEDDFDEEKETIEKRVSKGDTWQLGNHRLVCGDCTDPKNYEKLMRGERADIAFTSPPYNMQATNIAKAFDSDKVKDSYGIKEGTYNEFTDALSNDDYANLLNGALDCCLANADEVLFNIGILAASKSGIVDMLAAHKDKFSEILVWNKDTYMPLCLPTQIHLLGHICELIFCFSNVGTRAFSHSQWKLGMKHNRIDTHGQHKNEYSKIHHATFPVEFPAAIISDFTEKSIIDCFGGTGTTMIAAEQLGRKCFMMELDPHYCDVIIARWEKLTGGKATKLNPYPPPKIMFEKVNPQHPDKLADRIAGAVVDLAYAVERNPRIAVEVLIGHGKAYVIIETSLGRGELAAADVVHAVRRICPYIDESNIHVTIASQDPHLADNQRDGLRSGDNGIFRGAPVTMEHRILTSLAATIHANFPTDGKYIIATHPAENPEGSTVRRFIICQSNATNAELRECLEQWTAHIHDDRPASYIHADINPLGPWTGGTDADSGATNRKLGSDMGDAVSGGGLHGKDLSKMDVTANIVCHMLAQRHHTPVECYCAIGDQSLTFRFHQPGDFPDNLPAHPHITMTVAEAVEMARLYILTDCMGSFERFAEWGLIRPSVEA